MVSRVDIERGIESRKKIVAFVKDYWKKHDHAPSVREVTDHLGFSSINATRSHILQLIDQGVLVQTPGVMRSLRVRPGARVSDAS